jgi:Ca2+-binding EF-hand superfamily protein
MNIKRIEDTLHSSGAVTRQDLLALLKGKDEKVSEGQIEVLFRLLDTDGKRWDM